MIAALALVATSCSSEEAEMTNSGEECVVTISAALPQEMGTRSFSDATTAEKLQYAIYDNASQDLLSQGVAVFNGKLSADLELRLAVGRTYDICFWASANNSPYTFDAETQKVTISYDQATCNDEKRDAFYYKLTELKVEGSVSESVTLKRPFAQLNFGTSDKKEASDSGVTMNYTKVVVNGVYSTFDLSTGNVEGEPSEVTFSCASIPVAESFPVTGYDYLAMNYLLVPNDRALVDATLVIDSESNFKHDYTSLPVQGNYRTNVYGALITAPADFHVSKEQNFATPAYEVIDGYVKVYTQDAFEEQTAIEDNKVLVPENESFTLGEVADGVTIEGSGASSKVLSNEDNPIEADGVTFSNVTLDRVAPSIGSDSRKRVNAGAYYYEVYKTLYIKGDNVTLDNCVIYTTFAGVEVAAGKKAKINNCTFKHGDCGYAGVKLNTDSEVELNNCVYERSYGVYCIYSAGACKVTANDCVFSGWMSGWHNGGEFNNCTFRYGGNWYPVAVCYGNTVFDGCKFEYVGSSYLNDGDKSVWGKYGFNYLVSGRGPKIEFNNCTYTSTLVPEYDGKSVEPSIYLEGQGDDKTPAKNVYIDGECIFPLVSGETEVTD